MFQRYTLVCFGIILGATTCFAHLEYESFDAVPAVAAPTERGGRTSVGGTQRAVTGEDEWQFRVYSDRSILPPDALAVLKDAHAGFAVDRRPGAGETYFALKGGGIYVLSEDMKHVRRLSAPSALTGVNLHNATVWTGSNGTPYLTLPANDAGFVVTLTLDGALVNTLASPDAPNVFGNSVVNDYFRQGGKFVPTDVEILNDRAYVTTGYSSLDYVLTARVVGTESLALVWDRLAFGGRGDGAGQFGTGHGITATPDGTELDVADRPRAEVDRFTPNGEYLGTLQLPNGSFPVDVDFDSGYALVASLMPTAPNEGAPIYLLRENRVVSTIRIKDDLGVATFQHVHDAVLRMRDGRLYIIALAWNPGDFVVLEQVK